MKKLFNFLIFFMLLCTFSYAQVDSTKEYLLKNITNPTTSSTGGEWAVLGIARYEKNNDFFSTYYKNLEKKLKDSNGVLNERKYTEYSRAIIALSSINKTPFDVAGYNLITKLTDYDKVTKQGINGAIFALIALDCKSYEIESECREKYIDFILSKQLPNGGFTLDGINSNVDITAMAIQALSNYVSDEKVNETVNNALFFLSNQQEYESAESIAQIIVALCEMNIDLNSVEFVKNGENLIDILNDYRLEDGSFKHILSDKTGNLMATEQAFYALVAYDRYLAGKTSLYDMSDVKDEGSVFLNILKNLLKMVLV